MGVRWISRSLIPLAMIVALAALAAPFVVGGVPAAHARASGEQTVARSASDVGFPAVDPEYIYTQLATMATRFQHREAGYDTGQSTSSRGHDAFATYWQSEMLLDLQGFGATAQRDPFPIQGWAGRHATSQAFNVEVSVPGVTHPEQVVVIGCHYDGEASSTQSANDDASGCAIELGVAKALATYWRAHNLHPARTLRFVIYDAEEQGLYGSFHYVNQTVNGDLPNIVAMINEEQNGIGYPLRFLGKVSNPLLPETTFVTPLSNNESYQNTQDFTAQQRQTIQSFQTMEAKAAPAVFAAFRTLGYTTLTYHDDQNQPVTRQIFTQQDLTSAPQAEDHIASSDQYPFSLGGIPTATYIGNYSYYDQSPPPWSYPYDQPQDTIQLMNIYANGSEAPAQALKLSLALPGMLTTWTLAQSQVLGFASAHPGPIAAIGDIGLTAPSQSVSLSANAYDPALPGATFNDTWNFGDGSTGSGSAVTHIWASPGDYSLRLTVTDANGSRTVAKTIHVTDSPVVIDNPYTRYQQNGVPPANPAVTLPKTGSSTNTPGQTAQHTVKPVGAPGWLWPALIGGGLLVAVLLVGLGFRLGRPAPSASGLGGALPGLTPEEIEAKRRREQALTDLMRQRQPPEG